MTGAQDQGTTAIFILHFLFTMEEQYMRRIFLMFMAIVAGSLLLQQAQAQIQLGDAVTTRQGVALGDFVFRYFRVQNANTQPLNTNWAAPTFVHPTWTRARLGTIFGVALDNNGNSYVTAASCYGGALSGLGGGPGTIYRIDGVTNVVTNWANLPNSGPALGNICFDPQHNGGQFFVTNHEDGKIYRLSMTGIIQSTYDPFVPDNGTSGFAPRGERLWGIGYYNNRVYFSVWREDCGFPNANVGNEIRSIGLNLAGNFTGANTLHITVPPLTGQIHSNPVSDIEFTRNANPVRMLLGERTMFSDMTTNAHGSRVLEYVWNGVNWLPSAATFSIGVAASSTCPSQSVPTIANSTGGVDYGYHRYDKATNTTHVCDSAVWSMGDAIRFNPGNYIYGLQRLPRTGGTIANSVLIDYDNNLTTSEKTLLGDVDIFRNCEATPPNPCTGKSHKLTFVSQQGYCCCWDLDITNTLANYWTTIRLDVLTPGVTFGGATAPTNWTVNPAPTTTIWTHNSGFVPTGSSGPLRFCINPGSAIPQYLQLSWIGPQGVVCRDTIVLNCHPNPTKSNCPCGALLVDSLVCKPTATGAFGYQMFFKLKNNSIFPVNNATITVTSPLGVFVSPNGFGFPTIGTGGTSTQLNTFITGAGPGTTVCFTIKLCDPQKTMCCTFDTCIVLPPCKKNCCDPLKVTIKPPNMSYNSFGQVFFGTQVVSGTNLLQFTATMVSATRQISCPFPGAITPVPSIISSGFFNTVPPMTPSPFGTAEAIWESNVSTGSAPVVAFPNLNLTMLFPPPPGGFFCKDVIRFCIRYTYTDIDCNTCDTLVCYQLTRQKPWWHHPFPAEHLPFKIDEKDPEDSDRKEKDSNRSLLSAAPAESPVRFVMADANRGTLVMTSPALDATEDPANAITVVSITLEPAVGTDLLNLTDNTSGRSATIDGRVGSLTLTPAFPQGTERTFAVQYDNYVGALSFANYIKFTYYRGDDTETLYEDATVVYARVPNPRGAKDELIIDEDVALDNVRSYALRFKNANATQDYIYRVEVGVDEDEGFNILATGPGLDRTKVGLQAYRKTEDAPHLQMEPPAEDQAVPGAVRPQEEVTPIFVTVSGGPTGLIFTYRTYNESGDLVSEGTLVADNPLLPATSDDGTGSARWNEVGLVECYPNPMTNTTTFRFLLPRQESEVWLAITDVHGNEIARLVEGIPMVSGEHQAEFDGSKLPSGTYFYTLRTTTFTQTRRMQIVR